MLALVLAAAPAISGCESLPRFGRANDAQARTLDGGRHLDAAMREYQSGNVERALELIRRARRTDPNLAGAYELEALLLADLGDHAEYVAALQRVIAAQPQSAQMQNAAGRMLIRAGQRAEGLAAMQRAVRLAPGETMYARDLAGIYLDAGDLTTAAAVLAAAQVQNPEDTSLAVALARLYETAGDWARASASYRLATECEPSNAVWRRQNAKCQYRMQQFERAAEEYNRALETDINALTIADRIEFGDACLRSGDLERAQWLLDELVEEGVNTREIAVLRGVCALRRGAAAEAERIFADALRRWPDDPSLALLLDNSRQEHARVLPRGAAVVPAGGVSRDPSETATQAAGEWLPPVPRRQP